MILHLQLSGHSFPLSFQFLRELKSARMVIDWICRDVIWQSFEKTSFTVSADLLWMSSAVHVWLPQWYTYDSLSLEKTMYFRAKHDWWFPEAEQYSQVPFIEVNEMLELFALRHCQNQFKWLCLLKINRQICNTENIFIYQWKLSCQRFLHEQLLWLCSHFAKKKKEKHEKRFSEMRKNDGGFSMRVGHVESKEGNGHLSLR